MFVDGFRLQQQHLTVVCLLMVSGYNNNAAYPQPGYVNPIPWQHPVVPKVKQDKTKKQRPRRYVWNPDKYL